MKPESPTDPAAASDPAPAPLPDEGRRPRAGASRRRSLRVVAPFLVGMLAATLVFHRVSIQRSHTFLGYGDATMQTYAWFVANATALRHGAIKLWDFTTNSGESFAGELQTAPLYPGTWIFALLFSPQNPDAVDWLILFHFGLLFGFAYLLFRHNALGVLPSFLGAAVLTFASAFENRAPAQANIFASLAYMPGVILCAQKALEHEGRVLRNPWIPAAGLLVALMILAGHVQPLFHTAVALAILALVRTWGSTRALLRDAFRLCAIGTLGVLVAAPQVAAFGEYMSLAYRWVGPDLPTAPPHVVPRHVFGTLWVIGLDHLRSLWDVRVRVPEENTLFFTQTGLLAAIVAAVTERSRRTWYALALIVTAVLVGMGNASVFGRLSYFVPFLGSIRQASRIVCLFAIGASMLAGIGMERLLAREGPGRAWMRAVCVVAIGLAAWECYDASQLVLTPRTAPGYPGNAYAVGRSFRLAERTREATDGTFRYYGIPNEVLQPNLGNVTGALSVRGHRATMEIAYYKYMDRDWSPMGEVFRRLGVRYFASEKPIAGTTPIAAEGALQLLERPDALSIFQIASPGRPPRSARLEHVEWRDNSVSLTLASGEAGRLVFAQPWYPGWRVYVDGRRRALLREDVLPAVDVGGADRVVELRYRPWWLLPSLLASLVTAPGCAALIVISRRAAAR